MGQQRFEVALEGALQEQVASTFSVVVREFGGLRGSGRPGVGRIPRAVLGKSPVLDRAIGAVAYGRADLVHRLDGRLPPGGKEILTIHDLAFLHFPDEGQPPKYLADQARAAAAVTTVSEFSAEELRSRWGLRRVRVMHNGCDQDAFEATKLPAEDLRALGIRGPFMLTTGGVTRRKNLPLLAEAWRLVQQRSPELQLVLAGPPDDRRNQAFADIPNVVLVGYLARASLLQLMAASRAVVVPSRYEGFGLPVVEAMAMGTPVICTRCASLPEIAGDAAWVVPPTADGLADAITVLAEDDALAEQYVARGRVRAADFSWKRTASDYLRLYEELL